MRVTDDLSGVQQACLAFQSPSQRQGSSNCFSRISGNARDGIYQGNVTFPQYSEAGTWKAYYAFARDLVGNYRYLFTADLTAAGLPTTLDVTCTALPSPVVALSAGANPSCAGQSVTLDAGPGYASYSWSNGVQVIATSQTITVSPTETTTYSVTVTGGCGSASTSYTVNVNPFPTAVASGSATIPAGGSTVLNGSGGVSCTWSPVEGLSNANNCSPSAMPTATTTYALIVAGSNGCYSKNGATATVTVLPTTATAIASSANPSNAGQSVALTATVTSESGVPTGSVAFRDGPTEIGSATLDAGGRASFTTSSLSVGSHSLSASYAGSSGYSPSDSAPLTQVVSPFLVSQRNALVALYTSTNGAGWTNRTNWLGAPGTECTWFGVTCNSGGTAVTKVLLPSNNLVGTIPPDIGDLTDLTDLNIYQNRLSGGIPSELGNLSALAFLKLSGNQLTGSIPVALMSLQNLNRLELNNNQLSGGIPAAISSLVNLTYLDLHSNQLSGGIPAALGAVANLVLLDLSFNPIGGSIPAEFGNLRRLGFCGLNSIQLTGSIPPEIGNLAGLQILYLSTNQLSGAIPHQIGNLTNLRNLYLHENQLTGGIPAELGILGNLDTVMLSDNSLTGGIPESLLQLGRLRILLLNNNSLSGPIPSAVGGLTNVERLWLHGNAFVGSLPSTLMNLSRLNYADFRWNALYTNDPALRSVLASRGTEWESTQTVAPTGVSGTFAGPGSLRVAWTPIAFSSGSGGYRVLHGNASGGPYTLDGTTAAKTDSSFTLSGLASATYYLVLQTVSNPHANNKNMVVSEASTEASATVLPTIPAAERNALIALYNSTNGAGWTNRTNWLGGPGTECTWYGVTCTAAGTSVTKLLLSQNNLTGPIPQEIGDLVALTDLNFYFNRLSGAIPSSLGNLTNLVYLNLYLNQMSGAIPSSIGNLGSLVELYLNNNQLSGSIPQELGLLSRLQILDLHSNGFTGGLPSTFGNLISLIAVNVSGNPLGGPIPPEIGRLAALKYCGLNDAGFTGSIPPEIGGMASLRTLYLSGNNLTGAIPRELGNLSSLESLYIHNNQLTGAIPVELGNLTNLETAFLHDNRLNGSIPSQLLQLNRLKLLYLYNNSLSGPIPATAGGSANLERLWVQGNQLQGPLPSSLMTLSRLVSADLNWNSLYTDDAALRNFLSTRAPNWESTQTIAPTGVGAASVGTTSIRVDWTPIAYTGDGGGYRVSYSSAPGGPYAIGGTTASKTDSSFTLTGLSSGRYYLIVQSVTNPHYHNQNTVVSEASAEVSAWTQITPTITWGNPADITYGTALGSAQLNATADAPGRFTYDPPAGTVLHAGPSQTLSVTFTPDDPATYTTASRSATINVIRATPVITWANPADIVYGTPLSPTQLNATAEIPGSLVYSPSAGTVLNAAPSQALIVTFTPTDTSDYESTQKAVTIRVTPAPLTIRANDATKVYGQPLPAFSSTAPGFVNGDGMGSLSGSLTLTTAASATSPVGTYDVVPGGVASNNYAIAFANGVLTINPASTSTAVSSSANPAGFGDPVTFTATVSTIAPGAGVPTGSVQFSDKTTVLGSAALSGGTASLTTSLAPGTHSISAQYGGDSNFVGSGGSFSQTIKSPSASTSTTLTSSVNPCPTGSATVLTATVAPLSGNGAITGYVAFYDGTDHRGTLPVVLSHGKYQAAASITFATAGFHSLSASYLGDSAFAGSTSSPVAETVYSGTAPDASKTTITSAPSFVAVGQPFSVNALVEPSRGGRRATPTGGARLVLDGRVMATAPLDAAGGVSFAVSGLPAGIHSLIVQYMGDAMYAASSSPTSYVVAQ
jgi:Leucine-rich repeat (LRR) protein